MAIGRYIPRYISKDTNLTGDAIHGENMAELLNGFTLTPKRYKQLKEPQEFGVLTDDGTQFLREGAVPGYNLPAGFRQLRSSAFFTPFS